MRNPCPWACVVLVCGGAVATQTPVKIPIPRVIEFSDPERALQLRIRGILDRDVPCHAEYERFIEDLTDLGRPAVPHILWMTGHGATDRYVTESLLRVGGPEVLKWIDGIRSDPDPHQRQAFLAGVPPVAVVDPSVVPGFANFLHDRSPQARILALRKFHSLVPAHRMFALCRDQDRDVLREAFEVVSKRWLFLDHGARELRNLADFVSLLELHVRDDHFQVANGFTTAFYKERIARTKQGQALWRRARRLPWIAGRRPPLTATRLQAVRTRLNAKGADRTAVLVEVLRGLNVSAASELVRVLAGETDPAVRVAACAAGLALLDRELAGSFVSFLKDSDPRVRRAARALLEETSFFVDQSQRWRWQ